MLMKKNKKERMHYSCARVSLQNLNVSRMAYSFPILSLVYTCDSHFELGRSRSCIGQREKKKNASTIACVNEPLYCTLAINKIRAQASSSFFFLLLFDISCETQVRTLVPKHVHIRKYHSSINSSSSLSFNYSH